MRQDAFEASLATVARHIADFQPNIVHYIGHAGVDMRKNLILRGHRGHTEWMNTSPFLKLLHPNVHLLCPLHLRDSYQLQHLQVRRAALADSCSNPTAAPSMVLTQFRSSQSSAETFWATFTCAADARFGLTVAVEEGRRIRARATSNIADGAVLVLVLREQFTARNGRKPVILGGQAPPASSLDGWSGGYFESLLANKLESLQKTAERLVQRSISAIPQQKSTN